MPTDNSLNPSKGELFQKKTAEILSPNNNAKIWRYMDFAKFVSLMDKKSLYFARADKLGDPFEGSYTKFNYERRRADITEDEEKQLSDIFNKIRYYTFINCWHLNEHESTAMWKLYSEINKGIAIQSTITKLKNSLNTDSDFFIKKVNYIDYDKEPIPEKSIISPFIYKRISYGTVS